MQGWTSGSNTDAVRVAINDYIDATMSAKPLDIEGDVTDPLLFSQKTPVGDSYIFDEFNGVGYFQTRGELQNASIGTPSIINKKTITVDNEALQVPISKQFFDDQQFDLIKATVSNAALNERQTRKRRGFTIYNNSFTTELTNDSVAWFNAAHVTASGRTVDNHSTNTFSMANIESSIVSLLQQPNQDGVVVGAPAKCVAIPSTLIRELTEAMDSQLFPENGNNAVNFLSRRFPFLTLRYSPFLAAAEGGSDTQWFVLADGQQGALRVSRNGVSTALNPWNLEDNLQYKYIWEYREKYGAGSFLRAFGNDGTV